MLSACICFDGLKFVLLGLHGVEGHCAAGEHIVAGDDIYGGTSRLLSAVVPLQGIEVTNVDHTDLEAYRAAFQPGKTKLVMLESPTNPRMQVRLKSSAFLGPKQSLLTAVVVHWAQSSEANPDESCWRRKYVYLCRYAICGH